MTKKLIIMLAMLVSLISGANAAEFNNGYLVYADKFIDSVKPIKNTLIQNATKYNNSCGPTSLAFAFNYYYYKKKGKVVDLFKDTRKSRIVLDRMYKVLSSTDKNFDVTLNELKVIAKEYLKFRGSPHTYRRYSGYSFEKNRQKLVETIKNDKLAFIAFAEGDYDKNPVSPYGHIVIAYAYLHKKDDDGHNALDSKNNHENDRIYFFDPYFGYSGGKYYVTVGEAKYNNVLDLVNLAYLQVEP